MDENEREEITKENNYIVTIIVKSFQRKNYEYKLSIFNTKKEDKAALPL